MVRRWAAAGVHILREHRAELNALNVYPVPDGDTGTNLYLTFAAAAEAELQRTGELGDVADALNSMARGALLGARGNSGVILAQSLAGIAEAVKQTTIDKDAPVKLADLLSAGARSARSAVAKPQEGTALTVLDAAAQAKSSDPAVVAEAARAALRRTPEMLEALKLAGVVDAGGRGVVLLLDALASVWKRTDLASPAEGFVPLTVPHTTVCSPDAAYELMFVTKAEASTEISNAISEHGVSLAITTGAELCQIHIHCNDPEYVILVAEKFAPIRNIRIEKLEINNIVTRRLVAQAFGSGVVSLLADSDVVVVAAEPDARPSVQDFVSAALKSNAGQVLLLPSDKDSLTVANLAAAELADDDIECHIIPTTTIQQTLAAIAVSDPGAQIQDEIEVMTKAASNVVSLGFTYASRDSASVHGDIAQGDVLAFLNGEMHASYSKFQQAIGSSLNEIKLSEKSAELITFISGRELSAEDESLALELIHEILPDVQIIKVAGRQEMWSLLIGIE
ncbi:MAG: hypothetical protein RLZZ426_615 [Actinomycetota bacterium]